MSYLPIYQFKGVQGAVALCQGKKWVYAISRLIIISCFGLHGSDVLTQQSPEAIGDMIHFEGHQVLSENKKYRRI